MGMSHTKIPTCSWFSAAKLASNVLLYHKDVRIVETSQKLLKNAMGLHLCRQLAIMISQCIHLRRMRLPRTNHLKVLMVVRIQHEWCDSQRHRIAHKVVDAIPGFPILVLENLTQSSSDGR
jgi:hypothetical protein